MTMKLKGFEAGPKIFPLKSITWSGDAILRTNDIITSQQQPFWIRHLGLNDFYKRLENHHYWLKNGRLEGYPINTCVSSREKPINRIQKKYLTTLKSLFKGALSFHQFLTQYTIT